MNELSVLMPMFTAAMGAAIFGIRMEPTISAGRLPGADALTTKKADATQTAVQLSALVAIVTILYQLGRYFVG